MTRDDEVVQLRAENACKQAENGALHSALAVAQETIRQQQEALARLEARWCTGWDCITPSGPRWRRGRYTRRAMRTARAPNRRTAATWDVNYSSLAMSADRGVTWTVETRKVKWGPDSNFAQVAVAPDPGGRYLLFYGIPAGRFGAVKLMRTRNTWQGVLTAYDYEY